MVSTKFDVIAWNVSDRTKYIIRRTLTIECPTQHFLDYYSTESGPYMFSCTRYAKPYRFKYFAVKKMNELIEEFKK